MRPDYQTAINPPSAETRLDGVPFAIEDGRAIWRGTGLRWSDGQSVALELTGAAPVPVLPAVPLALLAGLLLGGGTYRNRRRQRASSRRP